MSESRTDFLLALLALLGALALLGTAWRLDPDPRGHGTHEQLGLEPCGYLASYGHPCPTCGMTTSFSNGVRLRFAESFRASPAGFLLCLATMATPLWVLHAWSTRRPALRLFARRGRWILLAAMIVLLASWSWVVSHHGGA